MGASRTGLLPGKYISLASHKVGSADGDRSVMALVVSLVAGTGSTAEL